MSLRPEPLHTGLYADADQRLRAQRDNPQRVVRVGLSRRSFSSIAVGSGCANGLRRASSSMSKMWYNGYYLG